MHIFNNHSQHGSDTSSETSEPLSKSTKHEAEEPIGMPDSVEVCDEMLQFHQSSSFPTTDNRENVNLAYENALIVIPKAYRSSDNLMNQCKENISTTKPESSASGTKTFSCRLANTEYIESLGFKFIVEAS